MSLTQQQQQKQLGLLMKKPENALCADCSSKSPCCIFHDNLGASLDFGVFVCMNCSGAHRSLGQSVTRIKSTKLDTWNKDWIWHMQLNNKMINEYYQAVKGNLYNRKPNPSSSLVEIKKFVTDKYVRKMFAQVGEDDPITNLKNGKPPLKLSETHSEGDKTETIKPIQIISENKKESKSIVQGGQIKKTENLIDGFSNAPNQDLSVSNSNQKNQINLVDFDEIVTKKTNTFSKDPFNSFSGKGAQHSTTNPTFDTFFIQSGHSHSAQKNKTDSFELFKTITSVPSQPQHNILPHTHQTHQIHHPNIQINNHYGHIHHHHYPHMQMNTTTISSQGIPHVHPYGNHSLNCEISLNDSGNSNKKMERNEGGMFEQITLNLNDFKIEGNKMLSKQSNKTTASWIDEWK